MASVTGKKKAEPKPSRGGRRAHIEELNGGGYKTTLHHPPPSGNGMMMGGPAPIESAHKSKSAAFKAIKSHFGGDDEAAEGEM